MTPTFSAVIGIVGNIKHGGLNEEPTATLYGTLLKCRRAWPLRAANLSIVVRGATEARSLVTSVRRELQTVDPQVPASNAKTMAQFLAASVAARRFKLLLR